jgi:Fur family zinc uptake transcriptional regulator
MDFCLNHDRCIREVTDMAEAVCAAQGLRFTQLRRRIFELIWQNHGYVKAYDILDALKNDSFSAKPPTVYRTLDFLLEHGLIHRLNRLNAYVGCSHPQDEHNCYFLICNVCGVVSEWHNDEVASIISKTLSRNQFEVKHISVEIEGKCQHCMDTKLNESID